jgi:hypothetical protein
LSFLLSFFGDGERALRATPFASGAVKGVVNKLTVAEEAQKKPSHQSTRVFLLERKNNDDGDYKKKTIHSLLSLDTRLVCESNQAHEAKRN